MKQGIIGFSAAREIAIARALAQISELDEYLIVGAGQHQQPTLEQDNIEKLKNEIKRLEIPAYEKPIISQQNKYFNTPKHNYSKQQSSQYKSPKFKWDNYRGK